MLGCWGAGVLGCATRIYKQDAMHMAGVCDPKLHGVIEKLSLKCSGVEPDWDHVQLGLSQLALSFPEDAEPGHQLFMILPVSTVHIYLQTVLSDKEEAGPEGKDIVERLRRFLRQVMQHRKLLLLPISRDKHYTLLAVSAGVSGPEVRYYEGLDEVSEGCWKAAETLCEAIGVSMPPTKANVSSQIGAECGICLLHWTEGELRKLHGEDAELIGWPDTSRMRDIRKRVSVWCEGCERERRRWALQVGQEHEERSKRREAWLQAVQEQEKLKFLSKEAAADARALACELSNSGESVSPLDVPEDFKAALRRLQLLRKHNANLRAEMLAMKEAELSMEADPKQFALDLMEGGAKEEEPQPDKPKVEAKGEEPKADKRVKKRTHLDKELQRKEEFSKLAAWDFRTELLDDKRKMSVRTVINKPFPWRVCSRCRYRGCLSCDPVKALRYHLVKQGYVGAGVWEATYLQGKGLE